jgi:hypothetical protein
MWESHPADAPDGIAVASSGNIYMALVGPSANQIVELSPDGTEVLRYPSVPASGSNGSSVPFDSPSSVRFLGTGLVVANQSFVAGDASHWAVLDVEVGEPGLAEYIPAGAGVAVHAAAASLQQASASSPVAASAPGAPAAALPNTAASPGASGAASAVVVLCIAFLMPWAVTRRVHHVLRVARTGKRRVRR